MDSLNHLLFAILLATPIGLSSYRFTAKILGLYGVTVAVGYSLFGLSMTFVYFTDIIAYFIIFYILYLAWVKKKPFLKLFMLTATTVIIAGQSHGADQLLGLFVEIPSKSSVFRPHNLWHVPIFALLISGLSVLVIPKFLNYARRGIRKIRKVDWAKFTPDYISLLAVTFLGYLIHIFADSITYDFDVWWAFPFSRIHFSLYDLAESGKLLGESSYNPWGWIYYYLTPALVVCAAVYVGLAYLARRD